ncbi:MAG: HAD-IIB family hydrolase [Synechococcus sp.]
MKKFLFATDLDATLIDHQSYSFDAALPAIERLKQLDFPIIFNSSKTIAEQVQLRQAIAIQAPFIVENGAAVVIPPGTLDHPAHASEAKVKIFGSSYGEIVNHLNHLRSSHGYRFRGFSDMSSEEVADITGLSGEGAIAAKQRMGTEPLLWEDDESRYADFIRALQEKGLSTTRGGRFHHVMAATDKGRALTWLVDRYRVVFPDVDWTVVALGDSPNDLAMLRVADIGVLIPNPHRPPFEVMGVATLIEPERPGPEGWCEAVDSILGERASN